ncbi:MAG: serine/threonine-protein kinase, partial [Solirubrobacteraceae bacterium]
VAPIYDIGEHDGLIYIASRWIDGVTLETLLHESGPLEPQRAVVIADQVASALAAAHRAGVTHRSVKPSSVLVAPGDRVYLTDFQLARRATDPSGLTVPEQLLGSSDYVAPEYIEGSPADARVDIYGLGCLLYESLTGEVPFPSARRAAKLYAHASSSPPSARALRSETPEALDDVITTALSKDPADRQQSAAEFALAAAEAVGLAAPLWARRSEAPAAPTAASAATDPQTDEIELPVVDGHRAPVVDGTVADGHKAPLVDGTVADGHAMPVVDHAGDVHYYGTHHRVAQWIPWLLGVLVFVLAPGLLVLALVR